MALFANLIQWSQIYLVPYGGIGLFLIAFMEAFFLPIPPDILLIPLVLAAPELGLWYAGICLGGSLLGAVAGYYIGRKGGRPLLNRFFSAAKILKVEDYFKKYGEMAVGVAALTPIPFMIFTVSAGVMKMDLKKVLFASLLGRGGRFIPVALVLMYFGEPIMIFLNQYFEMLTVGVAVVVVVSWFVWKKFIKKNKFPILD
jgi:membrane protein YqaA with SNARE-associated domain